MDRFSNFIFPSDASTYGENRRNRGLTRFSIAEVRGQIAEVKARCIGFSAPASALINFAAMADAENQHYEPVVFEGTD
jgi:hypothetical protein